MFVADGIRGCVIEEKRTRIILGKMKIGKIPIYIILPSKRMELVMSGPSGEPKII